jgi:hypothetical protein
VPHDNLRRVRYRYSRTQCAIGVLAILSRSQRGILIEQPDAVYDVAAGPHIPARHGIVLQPGASVGDRGERSHESDDLGLSFCFHAAGDDNARLGTQAGSHRAQPIVFRQTIVVGHRKKAGPHLLDAAVDAPGPAPLRASQVQHVESRALQLPHPVGHVSTRTLVDQHDSRRPGLTCGDGLKRFFQDRTPQGGNDEREVVQ